MAFTSYLTTLEEKLARVRQAQMELNKAKESCSFDVGRIRIQVTENNTVRICKNSGGVAIPIQDLQQVISILNTILTQ